jgi:hypothetical protein
MSPPYDMFRPQTANIRCFVYAKIVAVYKVHTQEVTATYAGTRNNIQIGTNDNTKKGLTNRRNTRTPSRNIELYHLDKWTTPLIEVQELWNFKIF